MIDPAIIFQRTHAGREEIRHKSHGLTQSERLVLIMVDGISSCQEIRAKLPALTDDRFDLALHKLQRKELVLEVFMPVEGQAPEELDRADIDRFLQQDPFDPVTIIFQDPEEALGVMPLGPVTKGAVPLVKPVSTAELLFPTVTESPQQQPIRALDEQHAHLADALSAEVRAVQARRIALQQKQMSPGRPNDVIVGASNSEGAGFQTVHWGWLLIVAGSFFILGFTLGRIGA